MRSLAFLLIPLLVLAAPVGAADLLQESATLLEDEADDLVEVKADLGLLLVGYHHGDRNAALLSVDLAGGKVLRESKALGLLVVSVENPKGFAATLLTSPSIAYVETNEPTRMNGVQWNGAQWNGAQWNGAEWNGAQWNAGEWDGAAWNGQHGAPAGADDPGRRLQWGLPEVKAPQAWNRTMGTRATDLCVLDSGVAWDHKDLAANAWTGPDGSHGHNILTGTANAYDDAGHGTHVAGIAAASVSNAYGTAGIGNVRVMAVKVLSADGTGTEADLAFGLAWCADHDAEVAVMALGVDDAGPTLDRALAYAAKKDVLLVASAGNGGASSGVGYPARDPRVVAVTATGKDGALASFSSRGPQAELAAPGVDILSTFPGDRFVYGSGTSQAVGFVAGAAALVRDANPGLSAPQARAVLDGTAKDVGPSGRDASYGHGLLDVSAAVTKAKG